MRKSKMRRIAEAALGVDQELWEAETWRVRRRSPETGKLLAYQPEDGTQGLINVIDADGVYGVTDGRIVEHMAAFQPRNAIKLLSRLEEAEAREKARLRDLEYPEFVPESVTDAAFKSQAEWWQPGDLAMATVLIPQLIEAVAEAAYRATLEHLAKPDDGRTPIVPKVAEKHVGLSVRCTICGEHLGTAVTEGGYTASWWADKMEQEHRDEYHD